MTQSDCPSYHPIACHVSPAMGKQKLTHPTFCGRKRKIEDIKDLLLIRTLFQPPIISIMTGDGVSEQHILDFRSLTDVMGNQRITGGA